MTTELEKKRAEKIVDEEKAAVEHAKQVEAAIPHPVGFMLLIALPTVESTYEGGIAKSNQAKKNEQVLSSVGTVIEIGPQAYKNEAKFSGIPWCKVGDYVIFRPNTGTRIMVDGQEFRLMFDDSIQAIVDDPRLLTRAT